MKSVGDSKYQSAGLLLSCLQLLCNLGVDALSKLFHAHGSLLATTLLTHGNEALGTLLLTYVIFDISEFKYIDTSFSRRAPGDAIRSMMFSLTLFFPSISRL